jgi:hypothetical protein
MKNLMAIFGAIFFVSFIITGCGSGKAKSTVSKLEKCLGNNKTVKDLDNLPGPERTVLVNCMSETWVSMMKEVTKMSSDDRAKFEKEYTDAINKSVYNEVLEDFHHGRIEE